MIEDAKVDDPNYTFVVGPRQMTVTIHSIRMLLCDSLSLSAVRFFFVFFFIQTLTRLNLPRKRYR